MSSLPSIPTISLESFHVSDASQTLWEAAREIRKDVFVIEQEVSEDEEWDELDSESTHWVAKDTKTGKAIATCRLSDYQQGCQTKPVAKLGRIAVLKDYRGSGIGKLLVQTMLEEAKRLGYEAAYLHGQTHARAFYEKLGFEPEGFEFEEAGIPHFAMRCML